MEGIGQSLFQFSNSPPDKFKVALIGTVNNSNNIGNISPLSFLIASGQQPLATNAKSCCLFVVSVLGDSLNITEPVIATFSARRKPRQHIHVVGALYFLSTHCSTNIVVAFVRNICHRHGPAFRLYNQLAFKIILPSEHNTSILRLSGTFAARSVCFTPRF